MRANVILDVAQLVESFLARQALEQLVEPAGLIVIGLDFAVARFALLGFDGLFDGGI